MDFRSNKALDYVSLTRNLTKYAEKSKAIQLQWFSDYWWLSDKYRAIGKKLRMLCNENVARDTATKVHDARTCLPFPRTTNDTYGWLASKKDFQLQIYGNDVIKYPNPMDEICFVGADVPTLAGGKGFF